MAVVNPLSAASLFSLKDWVVLVTGGGTGMGLMLTQTLATNGCKVYITGRRVEVLETTARIHGSPGKLGPQGGSIVPIVMDVTSKESIKGVVDHITKTEGYLNLLVNNAGVWTTRPSVDPEAGPEAFGKAMFDESIDAWQKAFLTNATSLYFVTAAFLPLLAKSVSSPTGKMGSVINNTSISGFLRMSQNSQLAYNASKAAAVHITRQLAYDLSHKNIKVRVNGIAPGWFPSEMTTGGSDDNNESTPQEDAPFQQWMEHIGARVPPGRMGNVKDLATSLLTLATNEYMWGTIFIIDGGIAQSMAGNM
ncbi:hypothetical protein EPUS_05455 [Endocarpon pusillum Z07020]|uniref:NAD(P)-binding protein n=1 Tax=Endocarpon pusillum (strain Z07020 / HMAS-L-300199) TaxID=1263415 RepID=U1GDW3_ENDPU|nr:uncharacterized protein EPUS_05455 [Endocarpon pusillum Z07020]ERF69911.1 hypothetical protein EPUS_05455 [Endocarpon pusillum Z07020]